MEVTNEVCGCVYFPPCTVTKSSGSTVRCFVADREEMPTTKGFLVLQVHGILEGSELLLQRIYSTGTAVYFGESNLHIYLCGQRFNSFLFLQI